VVRRQIPQRHTSGATGHGPSAATARRLRRGGKPKGAVEAPDRRGKGPHAGPEGGENAERLEGPASKGTNSEEKVGGLGESRDTRLLNEGGTRFTRVPAVGRGADGHRERVAHRDGPKGEVGVPEQGRTARGRVASQDPELAVGRRDGGHGHAQVPYPDREAAGVVLPERM